MRFRLSLYILVACCVCASAVSAGTPPVPIEGNLWVSGYAYDGSEWAAQAYYLHGNSGQVTAWPTQTDHADMSPLGDALVYQVTAGDPYTSTGDIWVTPLDGSTTTNISQAAGLTAVNCFPYWSPDASQIAFRHAEPAAGQRPCDAGFVPWVMNADGTDAHRVSPESSAPMKLGGWSANGHRLICALDDGSAVSITLDGSDILPVPNLRGEGANVSPDAHHIAGTWAYEGTVGGRDGSYRQLVVTDPDGSNPQVLVSQFVSYADAQAMIDRLGLDTAERDWLGDIVWWAGPVFPQWSPQGDRIAFLAALPFDPNGLDFRLQVQVWVYTLATGDLTRITDESEFHTWISWHGGNTSADNSEITVDNTTVAFSQVDQPGLTTIIWQDDPPALPASYQQVGTAYRVHTTALVTGPAEVSMAYDAAAVPDAAEGHLKLLRYDEGAAQWRDITTSRDLTNHVIKGSTTALGLMRLAWPLPESDFTDVSDAAANPFWALWEIQAACEAGIVQGYWDGYHPERTVDRASMAVYIARALAGGDADVPPNPTAVSFPDDVPNTHWAYRYVEYAVGAGVVQGYDATHYRPDAIVTRDQMTVFVARAKQWVQLGDNMTAAPQLFSDVPAGFWCGTAVQACVDHGVVRGYADGTYHPERQVTRDQMAVYVARAFELPY